jgi:hypothetical protein
MRLIAPSSNFAHLGRSLIERPPLLVHAARNASAKTIQTFFLI